MTRARRPDRPLAVGVDVGTSGVRVLVCDSRGEVAGSGAATYPLSSAQPGWAEQEPADWWTAVGEATRGALREAGNPEVVGIGIAGQMHGTVLLDESLRAIRPALLWCDARAAAEAHSAAKSVGRTRLIALGGNPPLAGFTGPQMRWLAENDGESVAEARWIVCTKDFVRAQLTGIVATDHSDASGTGLYDINNGTWSHELAAQYQVETKLLAPILESAATAGRVSPEAALHTGLPVGAPVAAGAADNAASALGSGVTHTGQLLISVGTSGTLLAPVSGPAADASGRCHLFRHAEPGAWYLMAVVLNCGGALAWWQEATGAPMAELERAAEQVPPGSSGVVALPYLSGRRMPRNEPHARATITGLSLAHHGGHIARAMIEGASYALADGLLCLRDAGVQAHEALVTGGATRHRVWREALTLAIPELTLRAAPADEGAARGACFLGLRAAGLAPEPSAFPQTHGELLPDAHALDPAARAAVAISLERFRALSQNPVLLEQQITQERTIR